MMRVFFIQLNCQIIVIHFWTHQILVFKPSYALNIGKISSMVSLSFEIAMLELIVDCIQCVQHKQE